MASRKRRIPHPHSTSASLVFFHKNPDSITNISHFDRSLSHIVGGTYSICRFGIHRESDEDLVLFVHIIQPNPLLPQSILDLLLLLPEINKRLEEAVGWVGLCEQREQDL